MSDGVSKTKVFVRPLQIDISDEQVKEHFASVGEIKEVIVTKGYGFVEFAEEDSARSAIETLNDSEFMGGRIQVEYAKLQKQRFRLLIKNIPEDSSWQDLKDFFIEKGYEVTFANVFTKENEGTGVVDLATEEQVEKAAAELKEVNFKDSVLSVERDPNPPPLRSGGRNGGFGGRDGFRDGFGGRGGFRGRGNYRGREGGFRDGFGFRDGGFRDGFRDGGYRGFRDGGSYRGRGGYSGRRGPRGGRGGYRNFDGRDFRRESHGDRGHVRDRSPNRG